LALAIVQQRIVSVDLREIASAQVLRSEAHLRVA
jgi:hypothetical protein